METPEIKIIPGIAGLKEISARWAELVTNAVCENIFYEPWFLLPALEHLNERHIEILTVWSASKDGDKVNDNLIALMPFEAIDNFKSLPLRNIVSWTPENGPSGTPLIHKDYRGLAYEGLLAAPKMLNAAVLSLNKLTGLEVIKEIENVAHHRRSAHCRRYDSHQRACFEVSTHQTNYFEVMLSKKKRKEFQRQRRRLSEQGELDITKAGPSEAAFSKSLDNYMQLESSGWKGVAGTAMPQNPALKKFFDAMFTSAFINGKIAIYDMTLDQRAIASIIVLFGSRTATTLKVSYDENLKKYSPGVLLMMDVTRDLITTGGISIVDSAAIEEHPMINHLWKDRLDITTLEISSGGLLVNSLFGLLESRRKIKALFE